MMLGFDPVLSAGAPTYDCQIIDQNGQSPERREHRKRRKVLYSPSNQITN